ncbi:uncharacterized protein LOC108669848 [Hyalella azteca]|uniref:Uncharacterized protein LOC108669848 n=1 Tax=Hyalella azteca TaxID=294128 RepID=A0A8B7NGL1_HYAAZ|nr:uncharacterized protein LOC108669848 [Hyalella azteca]
MEQLQQRELDQQVQQHDIKLQQHLQQQQQTMQHEDLETAEQKQPKETWHRKTSVMEIFRTCLSTGHDDDECDIPADESAEAEAASRPHFPQTKTRSRCNLWGPVYLNRDNFIEMHLR